MQDTDFDSGLWALVATPTFGLLIGELDCPEAKVDGILREDKILAIKNCAQLEAKLVPIQTGPNQMGFQHVAQAIPIGACTSLVSIKTKFTGYVLFKDMKEPDRNRHKGLVKDLAKQLQEARAREAGIALPRDLDAIGKTRR